ncbi:MAG: radical SAM family heme chaperone HemW [Dehalococcoidia bacterium]|nr:radical SAM family heme chaperone HemW [Dehalococcoidia bacterium]
MLKETERQTAGSQDIALYVHVPFCRHKCNYCSFVSYSHRESDIPAYVSALQEELALSAAGQRVSSLYFGGGTPSLLSPQQVGDILSTIRSLFKIDEAAETTLEANPGTVDRPYLAAISASGVNRLSLGVQSLHDDELKLLGRIHTSVEAKNAMRCARRAGFSNLNLDLIYGLPGQTLSSWQNTLNEAIELGAEHLSLYALKLEGDEPLYEAIERGEVPPPDPDLSADQYELAEELLAAHSYQHYEISNWAREGRECRHNLVYWHNMPYLGIGVAAHSYLDGHRFANTRDLDRYLKALSHDVPLIREMSEEIGPKMKLAETVILGLRLNSGVRLDDIRARFSVDLRDRYHQEIDELTCLGLLENDAGGIRLTSRGRLLANEAFWRFLPE